MRTSGEVVDGDANLFREHGKRYAGESGRMRVECTCGCAEDSKFCAARLCFQSLAQRRAQNRSQQRVHAAAQKYKGQAIQLRSHESIAGAVNFTIVSWKEAIKEKRTRATSYA
jgi:hypothetical protein